MKAIILATGSESRLFPITKQKPIAMICINGKPILSYILDGLLQSQIDEIIICSGYKKEQIINFCKDNYSNCNIKIVENVSHNTTNNIYSLYLSRNYFNDDTIIMNADLVFDPTILSGLTSMKGNFVAVDRGNFKKESKRIIIDETNSISRMSNEIEDSKAYGCSIGIYKFDKKAMRNIENELIDNSEIQQIKTQWIESMLDRLFASKKIIAKPFDINPMKWAEIDNHEDLKSAEITFNEELANIKNKKIFLFDKDGTLAIGKKPIEGANLLISKLREKGKHVYLLTNNSSKTPAEHSNNLKEMGINFQTKELLVSIDSCLFYLKKNGITRIFALATKQVEKYISDKNFIIDRENPEALLLTYDTELTYDELKKFIIYLRKDIPYFATHSDMFCPTEDGPIPDIGCVIDIISKTTGKKPVKIFGKPSIELITPVLEELKLPKEDMVIIGDRLYTDILMGKENKITSILVLSGETNRTNYEFSKIKADIVVPSINELIRYI